MGDGRCRRGRSIRRGRTLVCSTVLYYSQSSNNVTNYNGVQGFKGIIQIDTIKYENGHTHWRFHDYLFIGKKGRVACGHIG